MNKLVILLLLNFSIKGISQDLGRETYQADSIYKINNVKMRIKSSPGGMSRSPNIIKYDKQGRISELIRNNSGNAKYRILREYDQTGLLVREDYFYGRIEGEKTQFEYDLEKRITKMSTTYYDDKIKKVVEISYDPYIEVEKNYNTEGGLTSKIISEFDTKNILNKQSADNVSSSGLKSSYVNHYQNTFDDKNRLVKTIFNQGRVLQVLKYMYNPNGLLIEKKILMPNYPEMKYTFKYEYWE